MEEMGKCNDCWQALDNNSIVEWLALDNGVNLVGSIRIVHKECCYNNTQREHLDKNNLYDRWLPLDELDYLAEVAIDMPWDDLEQAKLEFEAIINKLQEENTHG